MNNDFSSFFLLRRTSIMLVQLMFSNNKLTSWTNFVHALQIHFSQSHFDDPHGALCKLTETTTIRDYHTRFELLSNRVIRLPLHI